MEVKTRRYDNRRRTQQARRTRAAVLDAARTLFLARGYAGTSIRDVADLAGVSFPTVYATVGNKAALLSSLFDVAVAGDDEPVSIADRADVRDAERNPDPRVTLAAYTRQVCAASARVWPILQLIDQAAGAHPEVAELGRRTRSQLLDGTRRLARNLADKHALRPDLTVDKASDILWMFGIGVIYDALVRHRHWTAQDLESWVTTSLDQLLLAPTHLSTAPNLVRET